MGKGNKTLRRKNRKILKEVSKEDRLHLEEFGESHPVYDEVKVIGPVSSQHKPASTSCSRNDQFAFASTKRENPFSRLLDVYGIDGKKMRAVEADDRDAERIVGSFRDSRNELSGDDVGGDSEQDDDSICGENSDGDDIHSAQEDDHKDGETRNCRNHFDDDRDDLKFPEKSKDGGWCYEKHTKVNLLPATVSIFHGSTDDGQLDINQPDDDLTTIKRVINGRMPSSETSVFQSLLFKYVDICYQSSSIDRRRLMLAYCSHVMRHLRASKKLISRNNQALKSIDNSNASASKCCDQGFTRPKVLILVPFRHDVCQIIQVLIRLLHSRTTPAANSPNDVMFATVDSESDVMSATVDSEEVDRFISADDRSRIEAEFGPLFFGLPSDEPFPFARRTKPAEWYEIFKGNTDDHFRFGMALSNSKLKPFTALYRSDVIIASALGIHTLLQGEDDGDEANSAHNSKSAGKQKHADFLSSIEVMIIDRAHAITMQNWIHIHHIMDKVNELPHKIRNTNIYRIKNWYLEGQAKFHRQTILLAPFDSIYFASLFTRNCSNYRGRVDIIDSLNAHGILPSLTAPDVRLLFHRFPMQSGNLTDVPNARFKYCCDHLLQDILDNPEHTAIFIPCSFDYIKVRNRLKKEANLPFVTLSEYHSPKLIDRNRRLFFRGKVPVMLFTERFHFYHRYRLRGIRHLVLYDLPVTPHFFTELFNTTLADDPTCSFPLRQCSVLYGGPDAGRLRRFLGRQQAKIMTSVGAYSCLGNNAVRIQYG